MTGPGHPTAGPGHDPAARPGPVTAAEPGHPVAEPAHPVAEPGHDPLRRILSAAHDAGVFSAAAWAVGGPDGTHATGRLGTRAWPGAPEAIDGGIDAAPLDGSELFDLASVTKPVVALAALGELALDGAVADALPFLRGTPAGAATARTLLLHTSGLPGWVPLWRRHATRDAWLAALPTLPLISRPGTRVDYSSVGFVLLGLLVEAASGRGLADVVDELVTRPIGAPSLGFDPAPGTPAVATERCAWRGHVVQGRVHDENAVVLGRPAGHAGLFGTLDDVVALGRALVRNRSERVVLAPSTHATATRTATTGLNLARGLGWQTLDADAPVAGHLVGPRTYGHTGFTGTSLFVDPDADRWYVLLTNRVHPSREEGRIPGIRARFHDAASALPGS